MESLRQIRNPRYRAILFRRTSPMLEGADGLIDRSTRWFPAYKGVFNGQKLYWRFPSGSRIYFGHMQYIEDRFKYSGPQFAYVGFDELTEFEEVQYTFLSGRNRAPEGAGLRVYIRAATNPGNSGHYWVKERFIVKDIVNQMRYFALNEANKDVEVSPGHPFALSRAFYPATLQENPAIGDDYVSKLMANPDPVERARLREGDWDIGYTDGKIFDTWSLDNIDAGAVYNPDLPLYWAMDDGYANGRGPGHPDYHPRIILFAQSNEIGGLNIIDEYCAPEETYGTTFGRALSAEFFPYPAPSVAYLPGEAATMRRELDDRGITTVNATHRVVEGIKTVRQLICDASGARRLRVNPRCANLIFEMPLYRADPKARSDMGELVPMKVNDHSIDALRYIAYHRVGAL